MIKNGLLWAVVVALSVSGALGAEGDKNGEATKPEVEAQTECPVMGGKINKALFVDHMGKRIYLCREGCGTPVKKDPAKYIKKMEDAGITLEKAPVELCTKCGEIKAGDKCCQEGAEKCDKCGLGKGSPGCCSIPKDAKEPVMQCPKCKEIMGTEKCCMTKKPDEVEKKEIEPKMDDTAKKE